MEIPKNIHARIDEYRRDERKEEEEGEEEEEEEEEEEGEKEEKKTAKLRKGTRKNDVLNQIIRQGKSDEKNPKKIRNVQTGEARGTEGLGAGRERGGG